MVKNVRYENDGIIVTLRNNEMLQYKGVPYKVYDEMIMSNDISEFYQTKIQGRYNSNSLGKEPQMLFS